MTLSTGYELATDTQFRELGNFTTPPRAGRITAIEASGQVRVETDDPDGGDVLAWPLNGFSYAVNDVVYVAFAVNHPESALVIGSKGSVPVLDAAALPEAYVPVDGSDPLTGNWDIGEDRRILAEAFRARDNEGLRLEDDGGNLGVFIKDGGAVGINSPNAAGTQLEVNGFIRSTSFNGQPTSGAGMELLYNQALERAFMQAYDRDAATYKSFVLEGSTCYINPNSGGNLAVGSVSTAQGKFHAHDGTGGMLFVTKTGITNVSQTIIPNATGDVVRGLYGFFVLSDGASGIANSFGLTPGNNQDISLGGSTWRLTLAANGALSVARASGSGTGSLTMLIVWQ
jgi:hypothetical protein